MWRVDAPNATADKTSTLHLCADMIRAFHPTTYCMDEAAYLPEGEECLNAVRPTGARIIAISWTWDGTVWIHAADTGPEARFSMGMTYDSARHRTVLKIA